MAQDQTAQPTQEQPAPQRSLARVGYLRNITKHPEADLLLIGEFEGWKVILRMETIELDHETKQWKPTLGVYIEIDSVVKEADCPWARGKLDFGKKGSHTITTALIRKRISQGLFFPLADLPEGLIPKEDQVEGRDVTAHLHLSKREDTADNGDGGNGFHLVCFGNVFNKGTSKTDEPRAQSNLDLVEALKGRPYYITEKVDGCSVTIGYSERKQGLRVCSRNFAVAEEEQRKDLQHYWCVANQYKLLDILSKPENTKIVIQGEIYGGKIQKNRLGVEKDQIRLAIFNVYDEEKREYLTVDEALAFCSKEGLPFVKITERGASFPYATIEQLIELSKGEYEGTGFPREGIVVRSADGQNPRVSFKVINNDYLLKTKQ